MDAPGFGVRYPFSLALAVELPLRLGDITQQLKHNVRNQYTGEVPALTRIQQGHVQHHNGNLLFLGQQTPLLQNFIVIAPQPVDALYDKSIPGF